MKLPILMYHNFSENSSCKGLTISLIDFEKQMIYLKNKGYSTCFFSDLDKPITSKRIIITFDDVTENQLKAVEILKKHQLKATLFIPFKYIGKTDLWNDGNEPIMKIETIKSLDNSVVELGLHSYSHQKYSDLSKEEIIEDFEKCFSIIKNENLQVTNVLAYPYGNYPKEKSKFIEFTDVLNQFEIKYALRIGNRLNKFPIKNNFLLKRIDVKGEDSLLKFKLKLIFGKLKLF